LPIPSGPAGALSNSGEGKDVMPPYSPDGDARGWTRCETWNGRARCWPRVTGRRRRLKAIAIVLSHSLRREKIGGRGENVYGFRPTTSFVSFRVNLGRRFDPMAQVVVGGVAGPGVLLG
jgi:hypothetical protein